MRRSCGCGWSALPKIIDRIRAEWGFHGLLVKFKLEVGLSPQQLVAIAEKSRLQSAADLMVANLYDGTLSSFFVGPVPAQAAEAAAGVELFNNYLRMPRRDLPHSLFDLLEAAHSLERE